MEQYIYFDMSNTYFRFCDLFLDSDSETVHGAGHGLSTALLSWNMENLFIMFSLHLYK